MPIQDVNLCLQKWFNFPKNKVFCQVATTSDGNPHVRTMDLYHLTGEGNLVLFTETSTRKWCDLNSCPNAAICLFHVDYGQITVEGTTALKTQSTDPETTHFYWHHYLEPLWQDFYLSLMPNADQIKGEIPSSFGVIVLQPNFWEILLINQDDFLKSSRKQYRKQGGTWLMSEVVAV